MTAGFPDSFIEMQGHGARGSISFVQLSQSWNLNVCGTGCALSLIVATVTMAKWLQQHEPGWGLNFVKHYFVFLAKLFCFGFREDYRVIVSGNA